MAFDSDPNVLIESGGNTFNVATDAVVFSGATSHFQYMKLAYGPTGSVSIVSNSNGLPVSVIGGGITANLVGFCGAVQGIPGGTPVTVSGTVYATGITSAPVYVRTSSGYQVEITGGTPLSRTKDSISVWGPNGITYVYANLVGSDSTPVGLSGDALKVSVVGAAINATVGTTLAVQGISGGYPININDTAIINGMTGIYGQVVGLRSDFTSLGVGRPSTFKTGRLTVTSASASQMDSSGYTTTSNIKVKALSTNTDFVYVGNTISLVGSSFGYALDPGESVDLNVINTNTIYAISNTGTQVITYIAS
jgi:hypothetical protein